MKKFFYGVLLITIYLNIGFVCGSGDLLEIDSTINFSDKLVERENFGYYYQSIPKDYPEIFFITNDIDNLHSQYNSVNYQFDLAFGSSGSEEGQFQGPYGIAIDSENNVYVSDQGNNRIQKFSSNGLFISQWGNDKLSSPYGLGTSNEGYLYVIDDMSKIVKYDLNGNYQTEWSVPGAPVGLACDSKNNIIVECGGGGFIEIYNSTGWLLNHFDQGYGVSWDVIIDKNDDIIFSTQSSSPIHKFSYDGSFISNYFTIGDGVGEFGWGYGVAVDHNNNMLISDRTGNRDPMYHNRIQMFDSDGSFISKFGSYGNGVGQFNEPMELAIDSNDNVYICDYGNNRIQKFRKSSHSCINSTSTDWANVVPTGNITYPSGSEKIYFNQAKPGANLTDVVVNFTSKGPVDNYLFINIQGENNITAYGEPKDGQVHAFFDATPRYGPMGLTVSFTDLSLGYPTSWYWDFGDGKNSTEQHSSNVYSLPGLYSVSLRVANAKSSSTGVWTQCVNVTETAVPEPDPVPTPEKIIPDFTGTPSSGTGTLLVTFQDLSTGNPTSWYWDFGDGNASTNQHPEHLYETPGTYSVTLTALNSQYSGSITKNSIIEIV